MSNFIILTDSSADLDGELAKRLNAMVLPLTFTLQGQTRRSYPDGREMAPQEFYRLLRGGESAKTAPFPAERYGAVLEPHLRMGWDVLMLMPSSALSGGYEQALAAAGELSGRYPSRKIYPIDTLSISLGLGFLVWTAARERARGKTIEEVRDLIEVRKLDLCHQFMVEDPRFLRQGGYAAGGGSLMGSLLQLRPVLHLDEEGRLAVLSRARGRRAALKSLVDRMELNAVDPREQTVFLSHGDCQRDAGMVAQMIRDRLGVGRIYISHAGPVTGAYGGPDALGLFYLGIDR